MRGKLAADAVDGVHVHGGQADVPAKGARRERERERAQEQEIKRERKRQKDTERARTRERERTREQTRERENERTRAIGVYNMQLPLTNLTPNECLPTSAKGRGQGGTVSMYLTPYTSVARLKSGSAGLAGVTSGVTACPMRN